MCGQAKLDVAGVEPLSLGEAVRSRWLPEATLG
jgi:hypothetical protein